MTMLEDRIRETLVATAACLPNADARPITVAEPAHTPRFRKPVAIASGAAALVLLVVGLPLLIFVGNTSTPPIVMPFSGDARWERVGIDVTDSTLELYGLALLEDGLIAVGIGVGDDGRPDGAVLVSADGVGWDRVAERDDALTTGVVLPLGGVIEADFGLIMLGGSCQSSGPCGIRPSVWFSSEGTTWELIPHDPAVFGSQGWIADATVTESGVVAVGLRFDDNEEGFAPAVWSSTDGLSWALDWTGLVQPVFENQAMPIINGNGFSLMEAVAVTTEGGLVAVGSVCDVADGQYECTAAVWTSTDGKAWNPIPHDRSVFASSIPGGQTVMTGIVTSDETILAIGTDNGTTAIAWKSSDGVTWTRLELPEAMLEIAGLSAVAVTVDGFVVAGPGPTASPNDSTVTAWFSPDLSAWTQADELGAGTVAAISPGGPGGVAVGSDPASGSGAIWVRR
jgi:hypothetical protein